MKISVVVPVYNEEKYIKSCLESLQKQEEKPFEIIIVDNNSKDRSVEIASKYPVRVIKEKKQGIIPARNAGFDAAAGDIIARCDADTIVPRSWLRKIREDFTKYKIDALSGKVIFHDHWILKQTPLYSSLYMRQVKLLLGHDTMVGMNMALTREVWEKARGEVCLDDKKVHEDIDLSMHVARYGEIKFDPNLVVYASARRIKYNPASFFVEYPIRLLKTLNAHRKSFDRLKDRIDKYRSIIKNSRTLKALRLEDDDI